MTTFDEYKSKVSIIQVAEDLGYRLDKSKGRVSPTYKLYDGNGKKVDEIVIKNPLNSSQQHYFDRNYTGGDLISFVKNHINDFPQFNNHQNEYVRLNQILGHYANIPYVPKVEPLERAFSEKQEFDKSRYTEVKPELKDLSYLTKERGLSPETVKEFLPFITKVKDDEVKGNFVNVAFPYHVPGKNDVITNYELRNYGFKGMASGGDKSNSVWIATNAVDPALVKNAYFFESAIDAMSFYELNKGKVNLSDSALVSVGGYISKNQILNTLNHFSQARINTGFDNDINGKLYDIMTYGIAINKDIKISKQDDSYLFKWDDRELEMKKDNVSLSNFRQESGLKYKFGEVHKPNGGNDFNDVLKMKNNEQISGGRKL
jgi:hypothetical protein